MGRMFNPVSFTAPATAAAPAQPLGAPYANAPIAADADPSRTALLKALVAGQVAPDYSSVRTPIEGIAKALTSGLQGWNASRLAKAEQADKTAQASALADFLMGPPKAGAPDPQRDAMVRMLTNGTLSPSSLSGPVATRLGFGEPEKPLIVKPGDTGLDPTTYKQLFAVPPAPAAQIKPYTELGQINADLEAGKITPEEAEAERARLRGLMSPDVLKQKIDLATAGRTNITTNVGPTGIDYGQPPAGMSWGRNSDGSIATQPDPKTGFMRPVAVPIGGGPMEQQAADAAAKADAAKKQQDIGANVVIQDTDRAIDAVTTDPFWTTGLVGGGLAKVPGTQANNVRALVETLKANASFDKLQAMRAASPTGGALGSVSDAEGQRLAAAIGNLDQSQTKEQLLDNLKRVRNIYADIIYGVGAGPPRLPLSFEPPAPGTLTPQQFDSRFNADPAAAVDWQEYFK